MVLSSSWPSRPEQDQQFKLIDTAANANPVPKLLLPAARGHPRVHQAVRLPAVAPPPGRAGTRGHKQCAYCTPGALGGRFKELQRPELLRTSWYFRLFVLSSFHRLCTKTSPPVGSAQLTDSQIGFASVPQHVGSVCPSQLRGFASSTVL